MKKLIAGLGLGTALAFAAPTTAEAQGPIVTGGLVNITVADLIDGDVLSNNNVALGVALNLAANICGVAVNVLATQLGNGGPVMCDNGAQMVTISPTQRQR
jgi:hypothetical protein